MRKTTGSVHGSSLQKASAIATAVAGILACQSAQAVTLTWDANGAGATGTEAAPGNVGGAGTWDTSSSTWYKYAAPPGYQAWTNTGGDTIANFATSAGTVTVATGTTINVNRVNITLTGYTIAGADATSLLNLDGTTPTLNVTTGSSTLSAKISGSAGLTKEGAGTLTLSGANTYSGGTTVNTGVLTIGAAGTLGSNVAGNNVTVNAGAILNLGAAANIGSNQSITLASNSTSMAGVGLAFNALPTITQSGSDPVLIAINTATFNAITSQASIGSGNSFLGSTSGGTFSGTTLAAGTGSTYRLGGGGSTLTVSGNVLTGNNNVVIGNTLTNGGGVVVLSGTNNYTGTTTVNAGTLRAVDGVGLASGNLVLSGGVYRVTTNDFTRGLGSGTNQVRILAGTSGFGAHDGQTRIIAIGGTASPTQLVWGSSDFAPTAFVLNNNTFAGTAVEIRNPIDINGAARTITSAGPSTLSGKITGSGGLSKTGGGQLTLTGDNNFTGGFNWVDPTTYTLVGGSNTAFGAGLMTLNSTTGSVTVRSDGADRVFANDVAIDENDLRFGSSTTGNLSFGNFTKAGGGQIVQILNQKTTFTSYSATGGTFEKSGTGAMVVTGAFTRTGTNTLTVSNGALAVGGTYTPNVTTTLGTTSAGGQLGRNGSVTAALNTANGVTWASASTVGGGLFAFGTNSTWGNATNNLSVDFASIGTTGSPLVWGGTTSFVTSAQTLFLGNAISNGTVTMQDAISFNNAARTIRVDKGATNTGGGSDAVLAGVLSNGSLVKSGDGTLELTASNTYTGNTTVNSGTLQLSDNAVLAFVIGATGVNNKITSDGAGNNGALKLFGDFNFNLAGAGAGATDAWAIVDIGSDLTTTFGASFSVVGFTPTGAVGSRLWTGTANSTSYQFSESTGVLSVVPEPASLSILGFVGAALLRRRGRGPQK